MTYCDFHSLFYSIMILLRTFRILSLICRVHEGASVACLWRFINVLLLLLNRHQHDEH